MLSWLLPREATFFDFFERHADVIVKAAEALSELVENGCDIAVHAAKIKVLEHQADEITHQCIEELHKTFITPIDRDSIFRLISLMDDIIDFIHIAASRIHIYKLETMTQDVKNFAQVLYQGTLQIRQTVAYLRELKDSDALKSTFINIHKIENEADALLSLSLKELFEKESDVKLIIKWKEIYETLETATDRCEDVANTVEGIILEYL